MTIRIDRPPSSTWPSDQVMPEIIGDSDDVLAMSDDEARVLLSRLFGASIPRTLLVQEVSVEVGPLDLDIAIEVSPLELDVSVEMEGWQ